MKKIRRTLANWKVQQANKARRAETLEDLPANPETGMENTPPEEGEPE